MTFLAPDQQSTTDGRYIWKEILLGTHLHRSWHLGADILLAGSGSVDCHCCVKQADCEQWNFIERVNVCSEIGTVGFCPDEYLLCSPQNRLESPYSHFYAQLSLGES
jgi:hypothetical protein